MGSGLDDEVNHIIKSLPASFKAFGNCHCRDAALVLQSHHGLLHLGSDGLGGLATIAGGFAPHQVVGLDGGGALVNGQDLGVAVVLRRTCFLDETHAAMHLHAQGRDFQAHLGAVAFDQWHQKFVEGIVLFARVGVRVVVCGVKGRSSHRRHGAAAFGVGTHGHEHAAHIGVVNDGCRGFDGAVHRAALHTVTGVLGGFLVSPLGNRDALHTHRVTGGVHHDEHVL